MNFQAQPCSPGWYYRVLDYLSQLARSAGKADASVLNPSGKHVLAVAAKADTMDRVHYYIVIAGVRHRRSYLQICEQMRKAEAA